MNKKQQAIYDSTGRVMLKAAREALVGLRPEGDLCDMMIKVVLSAFSAAKQHAVEPCPPIATVVASALAARSMDITDGDVHPESIAGTEILAFAHVFAALEIHSAARACSGWLLEGFGGAGAERVDIKSVEKMARDDA